MGSNFANEMADGTLERLGIELTLEVQMELHLQSNFYPPIPTSMAKPCVEAIEAWLSDDYERLIELPAPIKWRGQNTAPASAIVEQHRLHAWIDSEM